MRRTFGWLLALTAACHSAFSEDSPFPGPDWPRAEPAELGLDAEQLAKAREYALTGEGSGCIIRGGRLVMSWGDPAQRYDLKSTTKSIGVTALGLAIADGKIDLEDKAQQYQPEIGKRPESNQKTGWLKEITIRHLATQTAGFEKPGGYTPLLFRPGTKWDYSDSGPNWLAECVTLAYGRDVKELMFERVFAPIGITEQDLTWRENSYREKKIAGVSRREFGSGISANVDAMARIGYLYLREGKWQGKQLLPAEFVELCRRPHEDVVGLPEYGDAYGNASDHYGLLWWNNADETLAGVPRDAYWSWGLYDSLILVVPSLDLVVARAGKSWERKGLSHYEVLAPFFEPIVAAVKAGGTFDAPGADGAAAPKIRGIEWAPASSIVRLARGSDNWPVTWGDDGRLYTAYGDGRGFEPYTETKLSLGLATIAGDPPKITGQNLRSETAETTGNGEKGKKASGMLMVGGTLYMLVRNAENSQLGWSRDRGKTWTWADWKFTESFGCPTFLNYGKNYAGARDDYVYVYSFDNNSAYEPADRMVLARAPRGKLAERDAYEFFHRRDEQGRPEWTRDVARRGAVLERPGKCYRGGVTYNAPLGCYLWAVLPGGDTRFEGGLAVYEASEPWGPWHLFWETDKWDVGPGETASFPASWISEDGRTVHLLFSGEDSFSVRRATLRGR